MARPIDRLRGQAGIAIPTALWILLIFLLLSLATAVVATTALSQATRDGQVKKAITAADTGLEVAHYRMNKLLLLPDEVALLLDLDPSIQGTMERAQLACLLGGLGDTRIEIVPCTGDPVGGSELGEDARFRYWIETSVEILPASNGLPVRIERRVLSEGESGDVLRRVVETLYLEVEGDEPKPGVTWQRRPRWIECPAPAAGDPPDFDC